MTYTGLMRIYFNRHGAAPLVWCVAPDDGSWELSISCVDCKVDMRSRYQPKPEADDEDGRPSGWFEVNGHLEVIGTLALITEMSC